MKTITMKFGGTSVGSGQAINHVLEIVRESIGAGSRVAVVASAMSGITDTLLEAVRLAISGDRWGYTSLVEKIRDRHEETVNRLVAPGEARDQLLGAIGKAADQITDYCRALCILGEVTPRISDAIVSFGERLSVQVLAAAMRQQGLPALAFDASQLIITDDSYQNAQPLWDLTQARIEKHLLPALQDGAVPVITGFIGGTRAGAYTTLGRGGSDYSAAIFAAYLNSDECIIWTDVDGVMTTDPRIDKRARVLPYVSYQEVGELAYYGAKVLHPKTIQPIVNLGIPVYVRNTFNHRHPGTLIGQAVEPSSTIIKAVTAVKHASMLTVSGRGMLGVPGIAGRTFLATARAGANIMMISQSSSEQSFCFTVQEDKAADVKRAVEQELSAEIARQNVDSIEVASDIVIITAVGAGMRGTPGVAGRVFTVMGENRINVLAIAQGSSECSISFIVSQADLERAVRALHDLALEVVPA